MDNSRADSWENIQCLAYIRCLVGIMDFGLPGFWMFDEEGIDGVDDLVKVPYDTVKKGQSMVERWGIRASTLILQRWFGVKPCYTWP